jgi:hypothetical protein
MPAHSLVLPPNPASLQWEGDALGMVAKRGLYTQKVDLGARGIMGEG